MTKTSLARSGLLLTLGVLGGCSEATGPCDVEGACAVPGVDLVVESVEVAAWPGAVRDSVTLLPVVVAGDSVTVEYAVRNRGSETSPAAHLWACVARGWSCSTDSLAFAVPPLAPGRSVTMDIRVGIGEWSAWGWIRDSRDLVARVRGGVSAGSADSVVVNDTASAAVFLGLPVISGSVEAPPELRAGAPYAMVVTIGNTSRYGTIPADTLWVCLEDFDVAGCKPLYPVLHSGPSPELGPGELLTDTLRVDVPLTAASGWPIETIGFPMRIGACIGRWDDRVWPWTNPRGCVYGGAYVLPDLDAACQARPIAPDTVLQGRTREGACTDRLTAGRDVEVWSFDAEGGQTFTAGLRSAETGAAARLEVVDHDGRWMAGPQPAPLTFTVPESGRYHLIVAAAGDYELDFQRR